MGTHVKDLDTMQRPPRKGHWRPQGLLERRRVAMMHEAAVEILCQTGIRIENQEILAQISERKGFIRNRRAQATDRICIPPDKVAQWKEEHDQYQLEQRQKNTTEQTDAPPFRGSASGRPRFLVEGNSRSLRPLLKSDVIKYTKLLDVLTRDGVVGSTCGMPNDVPEALAPLEQVLIGAEYSRHGGWTGDWCDVAVSKYLIKMSRAQGKELVHGIWSASPLVMGGVGLDIFLAYKDQWSAACVGSMPTMGMTGPCDPVSVFTLALAECIGEAVILHELFPQIPISISPHPMPVDMTSGNMASGTPEWEILDLLHRDVLGFYNIRYNTKGLLTSSYLPDAQAINDHSASAMSGMLAGYRDFRVLGMLALDDVFCPPLLIVDLDILGHAYRIAQGVKEGVGLSLRDLPGIVGEATMVDDLAFAVHESTIKNHRSQYHRARIFQPMTIAQAMNAPAEDILSEAQRKADELTTQHAYEPDRSLIKELKAIYQRAKDQL